MGYYDVQLVCLSGHQVNASVHRYADSNRKHCEKCGQPTIMQCPECNAPIPGEYHVDGVICVGGTVSVPEYCAGCGNPYPWTKAKSDVEATAPSGVAYQFEPTGLVEHLCSRFHSVAKQLRKRYSRRVTLNVQDEYDVQDLLHALLRAFFSDVRTEEHTPSYAGKSARMDFLLHGEEIVIETKMTREALTDREVGEQLIIDIDRYKGHPRCKTLICFVYDPDGWLENPTALENDLTCTRGSLVVRTVVFPKAH